MKMITMPNVSLGLSANRHGEIEWLEVRNAGSSDFKLHFGSMAEPMEAVGACLDKLLAGWGIDVARYRGRIRPVEPKGSPGDWVTSRDYPLVPLLNHADGIVHFLLVVGADGEPMSCHVQNSSGAKQFTHVCEVLMRRAHFEPALDAQGLPMASYFRSAVRFEIAR
jgi:hypothetical protein